MTRQRRQKLLQQLESQGVNALLVATSENRRYLSGFSGSAGYLLLGPEYNLIVADGRYWTQCADQCPDLELVKFRLEEFKSLIECAAAQVQGDSGVLGVEGKHMVVADFQALQRALPEGWSVQSVEDSVENIRQCKDEAELELMRKAAQVADRAFLKALESLKAGIKERDFCLELEYQMQKLGARKPAFDSIVASGPNGAFPHAGVTDRVIQQHELITVDFGAYRDGYNSDITRTIWLGQLNERNRFLYQSVRDAQQRAVDAVKPGKTCKEIDAVARQSLTDVGLGEYFSHGLGHGIGLAVHELPGVRSTSEVVLEPGMVITIEPGVYIPGETGCRVEDSVLVTADGCEKLTRSNYQEIGQTHPLEALGA
ncbi:MAG: aminopeptidase P family protein [Candidatus Eremiobacteraeota bacterium]|nr:aminopeptidase P family protein [Candidatus Eremiobacteraeota bacterium]